MTDWIWIAAFWGGGWLVGVIIGLAIPRRYLLPRRKRDALPRRVPGAALDPAEFPELMALLRRALGAEPTELVLATAQRVVAERDAAQAHLEGLNDFAVRTLSERDAARAEVERLRAALARPRCSCPRKTKGRDHHMYCPNFVGPLTHSWMRKAWNETFGGVDYFCTCGGWFRQGGRAGHGDGTEAAEVVCPNADQDYRGKRNNDEGDTS